MGRGECAWVLARPGRLPPLHGCPLGRKWRTPEGATTPAGHNRSRCADAICIWPQTQRAMLIHRARRASRCQTASRSRLRVPLRAINGLPAVRPFCRRPVAFSLSDDSGRVRAVGDCIGTVAHPKLVRTYSGGRVMPGPWASRLLSRVLLPSRQYQDLGQRYGNERNRIQQERAAAKRRGSGSGLMPGMIKAWVVVSEARGSTKLPPRRQRC